MAGIIGNTDFNSESVNDLVGAASTKNVEVIEKKEEVVTEVKAEVKPEEKIEVKTEVKTEVAPAEKKEEAVIVAEKKEEVIDPLAPFFNELKEKYGVTTKEELEAILSAKPKKEETPEEKTKREKNYSINLDKYLQENNFMSREKIVEYENIKSKSDKDLAIENFTKEFKAENEDADEDDIADAVESRYHLKTENAKLKKFGESQIKKDASFVKGSFETAYTNGKNLFDEDQAKLAQIPVFNQRIDNYAKTLPATIKLIEKSKDGIEVNFDLTPEIRKQIVDTVLRTPEMLNEFTKKGDTPEFKVLLQSKVRDQIKILNFDAAINVTAEASFSKGLKSGSTVGAKNPFAIATEKTKQQPNKASKEEAKLNVVKDNEQVLAR